jgi:hypothetical protein
MHYKNDKTATFSFKQHSTYSMHREYRGARGSVVPSLSKVKVKVTLRLAVYRKSVRLVVKPLETDQTFFFSNELLQ